MNTPLPGEPQRVRILCRNPDGEILLLKWRDPIDAHPFWEPPGGGIEPGETAREAAVRELFEETGYTSALEDETAMVARDYVFAGRHMEHLEEFFQTSVTEAPSPSAFTAEEVETFVEARFVHPNELASLDAAVEPPDLLTVIASLAHTNWQTR